MKEIFDQVLTTFENEDIKQFAQNLIITAPEYWHHVPASSTGKYHPAYSLGDGGLVRHTIAVVRFLNHMFNVESVGGQFSSRERDLLRATAIAHDMQKSGSQIDYEHNKYTKFDHPLRMASLIRDYKGADNILSDSEIELIAHCVESHMGAFNTDKRHPDVILPKPTDKYQIILHLADYLASRKDIEMKFEEETKQPVSQPAEQLPDIETWRFSFGKHFGQTIPEVYALDPGYIKWAKENMEKEPAKSLLKNFP